MHYREFDIHCVNFLNSLLTLINLIKFWKPDVSHLLPEIFNHNVFLFYVVQFPAKI